MKRNKMLASVKIDNAFINGKATFQYYCSAGDVTNILDKSGKRGMYNLVAHRKTDIHCYKLQCLAGRKGKDNTIVKKMFEDIEGQVGKNIFILEEGYILCRSCKDVKIQLFGKGSYMLRVKSHIDGKEHKTSNGIGFHKINKISSFFPPTKKSKVD